MTSSALIKLSRTLEYSSHLAEELTSLRDEQLLTDFTIQTGDRTFPCHRLVLAAHSPMLKAMVITNMKESTQQHVTLDTISPDAISIILKYMYSGNVSIQTNQLIEIVLACDFMQVNHLKKLCLEQVPKTLNPSNVIGFYKLSEKLQLHELQVTCKNLMLSSFNKIIQSEDFVELELSEIIDYFKYAQNRDGFNDYVLEAALIWMNHFQNRINVMEKLVAIIKLEQCTQVYLRTVITQFPELFNSKPLVSKLITMSMLHEPQSAAPQQQGNPTIFVMGGSMGSDNKLWSINRKRNVTELSHIPHDACAESHSICLTPEGPMLTGGKGSKVCTIFQLSTKSWKKLKNMLSARSEHGSVYINGAVYAVGGKVDGEISDSVDYFSIADERWQHGPPAPIKLTSHNVVGVGSSLFVLDDETCNLYILDTVQKAWESRSSLPTSGTYGCSMVAVDDQLYVAGGIPRIFASYNISTDVWSMLTMPNEGHFFGALVCDDNTLFMLGRFGGTAVEEYNLEKQVWVLSDFNLPKPLSCYQAFVVDMPQ